MSTSRGFGGKTRMRLVKQTIPFFDIPLEIREKIYYYSSCDPIKHLRSVVERKRCPQQGLQHTLQLTCRQAYQEAQDSVSRLVLCEPGLHFPNLTEGLPPVIRHTRSNRMPKIYRNEYLLQQQLKNSQQVAVRLLYLHRYASEKKTSTRDRVKNLMTWLPSLRVLHIDWYIDYIFHPNKAAVALEELLEQLPKHVAFDVRLCNKSGRDIFRSDEATALDMVNSPPLPLARVLELLEKRNPRASFLKIRDRFIAEQGCDSV